MNKKIAAHQGQTTNFLSSPRKNNKFLDLTKDKQQIPWPHQEETTNFMSSPKSPWQGQTKNSLSPPGIQSWTLGPSNQRPPPLCNVQVSSSTFVESFLFLFSSPPWITCSSPVGNQREKMRKVLQRWFIPNSYSKFNFCLTPDLDVNQLGGDVGGSQLPHVEEGSGHVPAHHLYLPLPPLSGQVFAPFYRSQPSNLVSRFLPEFSASWCSTSLKETSSQL